MSPSTDVTNHDNNDENERYQGPETTKRRKHGDQVEIMGASHSSTAKPSPGSKESPIDIDGEEVPAWMAPPDSASRRTGRTYGSRLQESRPRNPVGNDVQLIDEEGVSISKAVEEPSGNDISLRKGLSRSREAKYLDSSFRTNVKEARVLGGSGKSDLETDFTTKKAPVASRNGRSALFDPVSTTSTAIEDHITGAATYASMHDNEKPRGRLPGLKNFISTKPKGPPGLKVLPGTPPGHAFTSSTPSLNRAPTRAAGTSHTLVNDSSPGPPESKSDGKLPDDLLSSRENEMMNLDSTQYAPLQPTRDAPSSPPSSYSVIDSNVIELDGSEDDTVSDPGSVIPDEVFAQVCKQFEESQRERDDSDSPGGGVPLNNPEFSAPLTRVTSNGNGGKEKEKDSDGDEKMDTPPSLQDEDDEEDIPVPENCVRFEVREYENTDHSCFLILPLGTPYHVFRNRVATGLGWTGVSGATFCIRAIKDATSRKKKSEHGINGDNWSECLEWMARHVPQNDDTSTVHLVVINAAFGLPNYMSGEDKEKEKDRIDEEMSKFRVPQIFGGDRPKREEAQVTLLNGLPLDRLGGGVAC
ncbi:putative serine carboxypeptidase [Venturia inaequalis]|nr:putative serine carboxypeptidase [Venturia inaequalis]